MMLPLNYDQINLAANVYKPSNIKKFNNESFLFWQRALFQRAASVLKFNLPEEWEGDVKDFFIWCLYKFGYVAVFNDDSLGFVFQPGSLSGYDFYYQPTEVIISNPIYNKTLKIGTDCELIKLTPDYLGIWDIISYYAEKLALMDTSIDVAIMNSKLTALMGAKNKSAAEALKRIYDLIQSGQPGIVYDKKYLLPNDPESGDEPIYHVDFGNAKEKYLVTDLLQDFQTLLNNFDTEIGIPTIPYQKKERMVTSEAESRMIDSTSRSTLWFETISNSLKKVNAMFGSDISVELRYSIDDVEDESTLDGDEDG